MRRVEKNLSALENISNRIKSLGSEQDSDEEISILIKKLDMIVRAEWSKYYEEFFSDLSLANKIISLYRTRGFKASTIINIISVIGNMIKRYGLPPTKDFFELFYELKDQKKINYYVSLYIMQFPQFHQMKDKWEYLLSVPKIAPKNVSERNFYVEIKRIIDSKEIIPSAYKNEVIISIRELVDKEENDFYKNEYLELMSRVAG
ncbi:hypothetical protein [Trabulsiella odontotermitis]|uniref:Uncharacterized protein n=1 Tax=Trabulsiella odontotermitis TaxID=379893 RepID=A0A0L0GPC9_9ENTR|nr:hypothetical protein [Trabulsiella odontotermitis]KNC90719.1 hypothetical protein GM31_03400 [Trabulsiella odontotermitis]